MHEIMEDSMTLQMSWLFPVCFSKKGMYACYDESAVITNCQLICYQRGKTEQPRQTCINYFQKCITSNSSVVVDHLLLYAYM